MAAAIPDEDVLSLAITTSNQRRSSKDDRKNENNDDGQNEIKDIRGDNSKGKSKDIAEDDSKTDTDADNRPQAPTRAPSSRNTALQPRPPTSSAGARLGQYDIIRTLGEGSFGKVKLATHKISGQRVALKIIARGKLVTNDMAGRIEREIQYLQLLRHPHIIKLFTVVQNPKEIVMVLEYAGGELFDYIVNHGRLQEDKARKFFQQIVCAIEYCHRHKVVHRDLKPENLLLDDKYNVKIADFGLSNIMTDGNFLKTSCGSPNYAAPEVISGKLYAGPEVDVWSCGVILYVLLTGRLPFDDDYIPALFKKIQQGQYNVPTYMSKDAARLIAKMLKVDPVSRITIQEIRQDPWFTKNLADYLQPTGEDYQDTSIDPNKAIDPRKLAPQQPVVVREQLHAAVVGKLGQTMGYAKVDVQEALSKDQPSAIKDAYLIVRENTIMKGNPLLTQNPSLQPFLASSPPAHEGVDSLMGRLSKSQPLSQPQSGSSSSPRESAMGIEASRQTSGQTVGGGDVRLPLSTIAVLPSSLPAFHLAYMQGRLAETSSNKDDTESLPSDPATQQQTAEQKAATARRLNPHPKGSQVNLVTMEKLESLTPLASKELKKVKITKWQFGIRSRNTPSEAMFAIYKALKSMGAVWEVPKLRRPGGNNRSQSRSDRSLERRRRHRGSQSPEFSDSDPDAGTDPEYATREERAARKARRQNTRRNNADDSDDANTDTKRGNRRGRDRFGAFNDWGYSLPEDPWVINARFRKEGMLAPGAVLPSSTHSSHINLNDQFPDQSIRRRSSTISSATSASTNTTTTRQSQGGSNTVMGETPPLPHSVPNPDSRSGSVGSIRRSNHVGIPNNDKGESCWVYVTVQLYCIEKDSYMVDFKCAGYERLVKKISNRIKRGMTAESQSSDDEDDMSMKIGSSSRRSEELRKSLDNNTSNVSETKRKSLDGSQSGERVKYGNNKDDKEDLDDNDNDDDDDDEMDLDEGFEGLGRVGPGDEKDINSPFPFVDVASALIVNLAQRD